MSRTELVRPYSCQSETQSKSNLQRMGGFFEAAKIRARSPAMHAYCGRLGMAVNSILAHDLPVIELSGRLCANISQ